MFKSISFVVFITCAHSTVCENNENSTEITLRNGSQFLEWWANPPVNPLIKFYFYNVTNVDEFLNDGVKPILKEMGPYVYTQTWKKRNIKFNDNGTVSFNQEKIYTFEESLSAGLEEDIVIVPNILMLSVTSQYKNAARFERVALSTIFDILQIKPFVEVTVQMLLWGYESPLLKLAGILQSEDQIKLEEEFGLMYEKNGTSKDRITVFTGTNDISKLGLIDKLNGNSVTSNKCDSLMSSFGFTFPPHLTKNSTIHLYEENWCGIFPLVFEKEVDGGDISTYRYIPSSEKSCSCHQDSSCSTVGFFNVSPYCRFSTYFNYNERFIKADLPILLSLPHFYLVNDSYRTAFEGISPPESEKHNFFIDVQPTLGTAVRSKVRIQTNLVVSQVKDIEQVATFRDIVFPIMWFEEGFDALPEQMTNQMKLILSRRNLTELLMVPSR